MHLRERYPSQHCVLPLGRQCGNLGSGYRWKARRRAAWLEQADRRHLPWRQFCSTGGAGKRLGDLREAESALFALRDFG